MELFEQRVQNIGFFILFDLFIRFYLTKFSACLVFKAVAMMRMMMMTMMVRMMVMAVMRQAESVTQKLLFLQSGCCCPVTSLGVVFTVGDTSRKSRVGPFY